MTAISAYGSAPITFALYSLSPTLTIMSSALAITWLLVITVPFLSIIKPEPKEDALRSVGLWNSLNISSNGDPGGNWNGKLLLVVLTVCVVEIFTTDGINLSARSANESGTGLAFETLKMRVKNMSKKNVLKLFKELQKVSYDLKVLGSYPAAY